MSTVSANKSFMSPSCNRPMTCLTLQHRIIPLDRSRYSVHNPYVLSTSSASRLRLPHVLPLNLNLSSHVSTPLSSHCLLVTQKGNMAMTVHLCREGRCHERSPLRHSARLDEQPVPAAGEAWIWHVPCRHVIRMTGPLTRQLLGGTE